MSPLHRIPSMRQPAGGAANVTAALREPTVNSLHTMDLLIQAVYVRKSVHPTGAYLSEREPSACGETPYRLSEGVSDG